MISISLSFRFVNDHLGHDWYLLYWDLIVLVFLICGFWKNKMLMMISALLALPLMYMIDHQGSPHLSIVVKMSLIICVAIANSFWFKTEKLN